MTKATVTTRSGKGSPLTHNEVDNNFTSLRNAANGKTISFSATGGADEDEVFLSYLPLETMTWAEDVVGARAICDVDGIIRIKVSGSEIGFITITAGEGVFDITATTIQNDDEVTFEATTDMAFTKLSISIPYTL